MLLSNVFVRFYKSFNYDYLRKHHRNAKREKWEMLGDLWYPFVEVSIEPDITTIVGANESGKSHLLTAIEKGIFGQGLCRQDFCRYSQFFTVEQGKMRWPDFGFEFNNLTESEAQLVRDVCELQPNARVSKFLLFHFDNAGGAVFVPEGESWREIAVHNSKLADLQKVLPRTFRINADVALPSSVPIKWLASDDQYDPGKYEALGRERRFSLFDTVLGGSAWFGSAQIVTSAAPQIFAAFSPFFAKKPEVNGQSQAKTFAEYALARDLIRKVAKIDKAALDDLHNALKAGNDGHANGIIEKINSSLAAALNFPKWWAQDRDFKLAVSPREHDIVFTIRDRTGTDYSFGERSNGLKYFLSYYVQYLAHEPFAEASEILLMDEPDAYLSSQAQQDLLKVFAAFAGSEDGNPPVQVIYVTHSPFLIDKNHASRIRVVEKGSGDEGTRVIRNASKNHYEPLRSAFGAFVGETVFIGNCNLMVEGAADQVLLAGAATVLQRTGASDYETLDLNKITIVPTGSASHVPYMVYLARGRDVEQPAVIVLLDSDKAGNDARAEIKKGGPKRKQLLKPEYVLQVGELASTLGKVPSGAPTLSEIEDLIPLPICVEAAQRYLRAYCEQESLSTKVTPKAISEAAVNGESVFKAIEHVFEGLDGKPHLDKIGFARSVCETISDLNKREPDGEAFKEYVRSMKVLFRKLCTMQRNAVRELTVERVGQRIERARDSFMKDHSASARREQAAVLFEDIERCLDDSREADLVRMTVRKIRRDFLLDEDVTQPVKDYATFTAELERIQYAGVLNVDEAVVPTVDGVVVAASQPGMAVPILMTAPLAAPTDPVAGQPPR